MRGVKAEHISATAEAVVPAKRVKTFGGGNQENWESTEPQSAHKLPQADNKWFKPTPAQIAQKRNQKHARQRAKQARFCAYSECKVTGTMFESPEYREVSLSFLVLLSSFSSFSSCEVVTDMDADYAKMDRDQMPDWVQSEYDCARALIAAGAAQVREFHKGNAFAQHQHDCVTMKNGVKYVAVGHQLIHDYKNFTVCEGFRRVKPKSSRKEDETASHQMADQLKQISEDNAMQREDFNSKIQDFADLAVAREMDFEEEGCQMHNEDKVGASAIGSLVRSAGKREVNPFPGGVALMSAIGEMTKTIIVESNRADLHVACEKEKEPKLHITIDKCKTRVAAAKRLLTPMCRMNKGLKRYRDGTPSHLA